MPRPDEDLNEIGCMLYKNDRLFVCAGCAGFADILAKRLELSASKIPDDRQKGDILVISGSVNRVSVLQMAYAKRELSYPFFTLSPKQKLGDTYCDTDSCREFVNTMAETQKEHKKVIIEAVAGAGEIALSDAYAKDMGMPQDRVPFAIARNMGRIAKQIMERACVHNMIVFGGDTLLGIMESLGCRGIVPVCEIAPGVVFSRAVLKEGSLDIVTKAGGFGGESIMRIIEDFLNQKD